MGKDPGPTSSFEEVYEALASETVEDLREELIQVAAVAVSWIEAIDRRAQLRTSHEERVSPADRLKLFGQPDRQELYLRITSLEEIVIRLLNALCSATDVTDINIIAGSTLDRHERA